MQEQEINQPSYFSILTADVRYDERLKPNAKLLYSEITALCNMRGHCWSSNDYFAKLFNVTPETISRWVSQLKRFKYINVYIDKEQGNKRFITLLINSSTPIDKKINRPIDKKIKHNNSVNNSTESNNCDKSRLYTKKDGKLKIMIPGLYSSSIDIYKNFLDKKELALKMTAGDGKAMKEMIVWIIDGIVQKSGVKSDQLTPETVKDGVIKYFQVIFDNWEKLEPFHKERLRLVQINQNIITIHQQIKNTINAKSNSKNTGKTSSAWVDNFSGDEILTYLKRSRS